MFPPSLWKTDEIPKLFFLPFSKIDMVVDRIIPPLPPQRGLYPKTCEHAAFHGKGVLPVWLNWGYWDGKLHPRLSRQVPCHHRFLWGGRRVRVRTGHMMTEAEVRVTQDHVFRKQQKMGNGFSPTASRRKTALSHHCRLLTSRTVRASFCLF